MKTESQLQNYLRGQARHHGVSFDKVESKSRRGMPDVLLVYKGVVVFVELKSPAGTGVLSEIQRSFIDDLRGNGAWVEVVASVKEVDDVIIELTELGDS